MRQRPRDVLGRDTMSSALPEATAYHRWLHEQLDPHLGHRVLDVGGGTGNHLELMRARQVVSLDVDPACVEALPQRLPWVEARLGDICDDAVAAGLAREEFDSVLCSNVLEHIENHEAALRNMCRIVAPSGGRVVLVLPAHDLLYGTLDHLAGHHRRYSRAATRALLERCGLDTVSLRSFNVLGALAW